MEVKALLDTNAVIYLQKGLLSQPLPKGHYAISTITEMELLSYHGLDLPQEQWLLRFIESITVIELNQRIKKQTIHLRKNHRLKLPDAIITASAIEYGFTLITHDKKMKKIPNLALYNIELSSK